MAPLTPEQAMSVFHATQYLVYCNCEITLVHRSVDVDLAMAGALEALKVADFGRCPKCLALIRFATITGTAPIGASIVMAFNSLPITELRPSADED